jgi:hypothetical protein
MNKKITIEIDSCRKCPFFKAGSSYSLDGFDRGYDWTCTSNNKTIAGFVESTQEEERIEIPEWCPEAKK